jgi:hypothetical protein
MTSANDLKCTNAAADIPAGRFQALKLKSFRLEN